MKRTIKYMVSIIVILCIFLSNTAFGVESFETLPNAEQLNTPTYDGSGQAVHPDIYFNPNGWNGYKYWMTMTPYPGGNSVYENPSVLVSNDGISWKVPTGLTNPIDQQPPKGSNSDVEIVYNGNQLEIYYVESGGGTSFLRRKVSTDGVQWSEEQSIFDLPDYQIMSPAIVKVGSEYNMWYTGGANCNSDIAIKLKTSTDGVSWSSAQSVNINHNVNVWHVDVQYVNGKYWMLYSAYPKGSNCGNTDLYFATSSDKINWITEGTAPIMDRTSFYSAQTYRTTFFVSDEKINVWISGRTSSNIWHIGYTSANLISTSPTPTPIPTYTPSVTGLPQESQISDGAGATRAFSITANQTVNVTWYINGTEVKSSEKGVTSAIYTNTSAVQGTWIVNATATNANGTVSKEWNWIVNPPSLSLMIIIASPLNNSENKTGNVNVTVNLSKNATAFLNWNSVNESMDGVGTKLYKLKTGLLTGKYNFMIYANDSTGNRNISETRTITIDRKILLDINISTFIVNDTINILSPGGNVTVTIPNGTNASSNGSYLSWISINSLAKVNSTFKNFEINKKAIGEILELGPESAVFRPDIHLRFNYTHSQLETAGVGESDLAVKYYNTSASTWENLEILERNTTNNYIIVNSSHFGTFALVSIVPTPPSSGGSGGGSSSGGGGGGGSSGESYSNILLIEKRDLEISKDTLTSFKFTDQNNPIMFVNITGNTNYGTITTSVEVLKNTSSLAKTKPEGLVYKNVNIWAGTSGFATPKNIKEASIMFRVNTSWISANNLTSSDVKLLRYDDGKWIPLDTKEKDKIGTNTYFEGKTTSFSEFAISGIKAQGGPAERGVPNEVEIKSALPVAATNTTTNTTTIPEKKSPGFGIVTLIAALSTFYLFQRKRR